MSRLDIKLFGVLQVARSGEAPARFPGRKVRELFAYLVLHRDQPCPREQLADIFWGDQDFEQARHCLSTAVWRLQRTLNPSGTASRAWLRSDGLALSFDRSSDVTLDVAEFEACCNWAGEAGGAQPERQAALCQRAITLYRGDLLSECYEDWCLTERERLRRRYLEALRLLLTFHRGRGEHEAGIACARRLLAADPLQEEIQRTLIELYRDAGQPAAALRQYRAYEAQVRRELGGAPLPETRALLTRLIPLGSVGDPAPGPSAAPADPAQELIMALEGLRAAVRGFERARGQAVAAVASVERSLRYFAPAAAPHELPAANTVAREAAVRQAEALLGEVTRELDGVARPLLVAAPYMAPLPRPIRCRQRPASALPT